VGNPFRERSWELLEIDGAFEWGGAAIDGRWAMGHGGKDLGGWVRPKYWNKGQGRGPSAAALEVGLARAKTARGWHWRRASTWFRSRRSSMILIRWPNCRRDLVHLRAVGWRDAGG